MASLIGVVGLGVMGSSLALNMERHGFPVAVYNRDAAKTHALIQGAAAGKAMVGTERPEELVSVLERPRRILLMVRAGAAVDSVIALFAPLLAPGDILMDGGNSFFLDTDRRSRELEPAGFNFLGIGVSGGEEGALWGPSLMPGGQREAWEAVAPMFRAIAARAEDGEPCVALIGPRGAGHYVKMVHNGIEYGDMQLIAETYDLLHRGLGLSAGELADLFAEWNAGDLKSYLVEITATILRRRDEETGRPLVELVLDEAQQKGTGKWTSQNALDVGAPVHTINAAVESRIVSALKSQRVEASRLLRGPRKGFRGNRERLIGAARDALYTSKILSYAQGFGLLAMASAEYGYGLHLAEIARIWRAGCIIRAALLNDIAAAYRRKPALPNLLLDRTIKTAVNRRQAALRLAVRTAVDLGIPLPAHMASLAYFDAYRSACLPANLTQAQRDHFGAHTYRRLDRAGVFHTDWGR